MEEVVLRTADGIRESAGVSYYERMITCPCGLLNPEHGIVNFYLSRAYMSTQIFVYLRDRENGKMYLKSLNTNVFMVDELNSFDFVED